MIKRFAKWLCGYEEMVNRASATIQNRDDTISNMRTELRTEGNRLSVTTRALGVANEEIEKLKADKEWLVKDAKESAAKYERALNTLAWVCQQETPNASGTVKRIVRRVRADMETQP